MATCRLCQIHSPKSARRFGKSLLTSTLHSYFAGERELFEGLKIMELEQE